MQPMIQIFLNNSEACILLPLSYRITKDKLVAKSHERYLKTKLNFVNRRNTTIQKTFLLFYRLSMVIYL